MSAINNVPSGTTFNFDMAAAKFNMAATKPEVTLTFVPDAMRLRRSKC
jgi:hypothetical protein